jgi:hypothetical protein
MDDPGAEFVAAPQAVVFGLLILNHRRGKICSEQAGRDRPRG